MNSIRALGDISLSEYQSMVKNKAVTNHNGNNNPNPLSLTPMHNQQVNQITNSGYGAQYSHTGSTTHNLYPFQPQQQQQQQQQQQATPQQPPDDRDLIIQSINNLNTKRRRLDTPELKSY